MKEQNLKFPWRFLLWRLLTVNLRTCEQKKTISYFETFLFRRFFTHFEAGKNRREEKKWTTGGEFEKKSRRWKINKNTNTNVAVPRTQT